MPSNKPRVNSFSSFQVTKLTSSQLTILHFEAKVQPNISRTETSIDLNSSRKHSREVLKSVSLPNWDCCGGDMTPNLFCVLLGVRYIACLCFFFLDFDIYVSWNICLVPIGVCLGLLECCVSLSSCSHVIYYLKMHYFRTETGIGIEGSALPR